MEDTRKGFLTPEQEVILDELIELDGVKEVVDGPAIRLADNQGLQRVKEKFLEKDSEMLPMIYEVVDGIFEILSDIVESKKRNYPHKPSDEKD